jgi:hypothetical protein
MYNVASPSTVADFSYDFEARYPNLALVHCLVMATVIDKFGWVITCAICPPLNFFDFKDDLYAILKSFKILK